MQTHSATYLAGLPLLGSPLVAIRQRWGWSLVAVHGRLSIMVVGPRGQWAIIAVRQWWCWAPVDIRGCGQTSMVGVVPRRRSWALVDGGGGSLWPVGHCRCLLMVVLGACGHSCVVVAIPRSWWWILVANCRWSWWVLVVFHGGCQKRVW